MNNFFETPKGISLNTYRNLPAYLRKSISIKEIFAILQEKNKFMDTLTYSEKCITSEERIAGILQRRLYKKDYYLDKHFIKYVLKAEEAYYQYLYMNYVD